MRRNIPTVQVKSKPPGLTLHKHTHMCLFVCLNYVWVFFCLYLIIIKKRTVDRQESREGDTEQRTTGWGPTRVAAEMTQPIVHGAEPPVSTLRNELFDL